MTHNPNSSPDAPRDMWAVVGPDGWAHASYEHEDGCLGYMSDVHPPNGSHVVCV